MLLCDSRFSYGDLVSPALIGWFECHTANVIWHGGYVLWRYFLFGKPLKNDVRDMYLTML